MIKIKFKDKIFKVSLNNSFYDTLDLVKSIPERRWIKEEQAWEIPARISNYKLLCKCKVPQELHDYIIILKKEALVKRKIEKKKTDKSFNYIKEKYSFLYDFQVEAVNKILNSERINFKGYLLSLDQGLGKTLTSLICANEFLLENKIDNVWIVCPASLNVQWSDEIIKWLKIKNIKLHVGSKKKREEFYVNSKSQFNIISYETLRNDINLIKKLQMNSKTLVIIDESSKLKNSTTAVYKAISKLRNIIKYSIYLTGTPLTNALKDINNVVNLIKFRLAGPISQYCVYEDIHIGWGPNSRTVPQLVGYKNLDLFVDKIKSVYFRKNKNEVASQLPEKIISRIDIKHLPAYHKLSYDIIDDIGAFSGFSLLMMLDSGIEVLSQSDAESMEILELPEKIPVNYKIKTLIELVEEIGDNKIIIFSHFINSLSNIKKELKLKFKDKKILTIQDGTKEEIKKEFMEGDIDIVIASDKWSHGVSLDNIDYLINYDIVPSLETYLQRQDRIHRINSKKTKFIYNLVGDVIEKHIMDILEEKLILFEKVVEGKEGKVSVSSIKEDVIKKLGR